MYDLIFTMNHDVRPNSYDTDLILRYAEECGDFTGHLKVSLLSNKYQPMCLFVTAGTGDVCPYKVFYLIVK